MAKRNSSKKRSSSSKTPTVKVKVAGARFRVPWWVFLTLVVVAGVAVAGYFVYTSFRGGNGGSSSSNVITSSATSSMGSSLTSSEISISTVSSSPSLTSGGVEASPISFHFLQLKNAHTGDCTYIKAGDNDILIDAGSKSGCATTIESYLEDSTRGGDYVKDGKLEYVIATHAHEDHISGFAGNVDSSLAGGRTGIFYHYKVDHLVDFSYYDDSTKKVLSDNRLTSTSASTTTVYKNYLAARNYAIAQGMAWQTAGQMWASSTHTIPLGNNLSMTLLYNYFYDHTSANVKDLGSYSFSSQNDCSVSVLFTQGSKNFLFTGDSEAAAEYSLTKYNTLPEVQLFKGGHHGSGTANTDALLSVIKPQVVCVCCCAGNSEYASNLANTFPAQEAVNRIAPYTDRVYVTELGSFTDSSHYEPMNGDITMAYGADSTETLTCSSNALKLKDTAWFSANRTMPKAWK